VIEATQVLGGWLLAALLAIAVVAAAVRAWRRRAALNEALHELRRPLQAIALTPALEAGGSAETPVQLAAAALARLEREINGGAAAPEVEAFPVRPVLEAAVRRWEARAALRGASIELAPGAGAGARIRGDRVAIAQSLDNLLVNAIEHGGSSIRVEAEARAGRLRVAVADSGRSPSPADRRAEELAPVSGGPPRGHGLVVVRRVVAAHRGRFVLSCTDRGARAVMELPLAEGSSRAA
jgi:signal transduction histidine kinase